MAGTPLSPHTSPHTSNIGNNHSGRVHQKGPKSNPGHGKSNATTGTRSGQNYPPRPAGFQHDVTGSPVKGVKVGGANGSGSGFGSNSGIK